MLRDKIPALIVQNTQFYRSQKKKKLVCGQSDSLLHRFPLYIDLSHFGHQLHLLTWFHLSLFKTYYKGAQILKDIESFV